jgi:glyoxylase-like metal-dependent hydrolase (beta-lactamase superfamily II)
MYDSLRRLAALPDNLPIYPGHSYGGKSSTIGREKATGFLRNDITRAQWMNSMAR